MLRIHNYDSFLLIIMILFIWHLKNWFKIIILFLERFINRNDQRENTPASKCEPFVSSSHHRFHQHVVISIVIAAIKS